jgi:copper chaperone NosL
MTRSAPLLVAALAAASCQTGGAPPAALDTRNEACRWCRMAVSDPAFAAQLAAPGEEPRFFDDIGCLRDFLRDGGDLPPHAIAYVADHRTRAWVPAAQAVYTRVPELQTPMGSRLVAHADAASRDADVQAAPGTPLRASDVFGPAGPPGDRP